MGRRAVAATLVSFLVFTSLLLANSALYSSEYSSLGAAVLSASQTRERAYGGVLIGLSTYTSMLDVQEFLQANVLECTSARPYLSSIAGTQGAAGADQGITYSTKTTWAYESSPTPLGGSEYLPTFGGYVAGELNFDVVTSLAESYGGGLPSYSIVREETIHFPVPIDQTISLCLEALQDLAGALSSLPYCNSSAVDNALRLADSNYALLDSYAVGAYATLVQSGCKVEYWITTTLDALEGVSGAFQMTFLGEGSLGP